MKKSISFLTFLVITIVVLSVIQIAVSNRLSTSGIELAKMQNEIDSYKTENSILSEKFLISSSLTNIASSAGEIGFVEGKNQVYLNAPLPLAVR